MKSTSVKMQDIAQSAKVSVSTVSCVLNGRRQGVWISENTRSRVMAAAEKMGYQPNDLARAVVTGKNRMLGFLGFNSRYESAGRMLEAALAEAENLGYTIKVLHSRDGILDQSMIESCVRSRLSGLITLFQGDHNLDNLRTEAARYKIHVALVDNSLPNSWGIRVVSDDSQGTNLAVDHLADLGHAKIVFFGLSWNAPMQDDRERGYREAIVRHGFPTWERSIVLCENTMEATGNAVESILRDPMKPTAIVCATDDTSFMVLKHLHSLGARVPNDISLTGFADLYISQLVEPALTTVAQPFSEMGAIAVKHLVSRIESSDESYIDDPIQEVLPTRLIVRQSTGPCA